VVQSPVFVKAICHAVDGRIATDEGEDEPFQTEILLVLLLQVLLQALGLVLAGGGGPRRAALIHVCSVGVEEARQLARRLPVLKRNEPDDAENSQLFDPSDSAESD